MFIVDIPDTISQLPQIIRSKHQVLSKIRTSQLSKDPLKTRLVFHIPEKTKAKTLTSRTGMPILVAAVSLFPTA